MRDDDKDFKEEAIKLSYEIGLKAAAEKLGIPTITLSSWRSRTKQYGEIAFVGSGYKRIDPKMAEIRLMEKKIKDLEDANDVRKKPWVFSQEPKEVAAREIFQWIWLHKTKEKTKYSIKTMCLVLEVSEAGYYKWLKR